MLTIGSVSSAQHALLPCRPPAGTPFTLAFDAPIRCSCFPTIKPGTLSVRWNLVGDVSTSHEIKRWNFQIRSASEGSSKQPEFVSEKSIWPCLLPRPLIYSSNFSDVDPVQLSELWAMTLKVRRDPKKIVKALRHSFAFVVVLAEDDEVSSSGVTRPLKTVGVGRAISDGTFIASICDVAVDPAYQHRGIGRRIVKKLVENMKKTGGPSGYAVFPPPIARRFFWMIGFRSDKKYRLMAYRGQGDERDVKLIPRENIREDKELVRSTE
ncbi:aralkylamine N-acetyltransferase [Marchantia polymorpha subsp. ruderalis]